MAKRERPTAQDGEADMPGTTVAGVTEAEAALDVVKHAPFNAESPPAALVMPVTPTGQIYVRSNFPFPALDGDDHRVEIGGMVRSEYSVSVRELRGMTAVHSTVTVTMECAGNDRLAIRPLPAGEPWRTNALSTSRWTGVPLRTLLDRARLHDRAREILVEGADGGTVEGNVVRMFGRSLPLDKALAPETLLAFAVNGEPLTLAHGAPLRLVVPGWYGMASVKWVTRITAIERAYDGYFQRDRYVYDEPGRGISPVTTMRVKSMITAPTEGDRMERARVQIEGWAWSGDGAITRVEVATGGGDTWSDARLTPPESPHAWTRWTGDWTPAEPGRYALRSRATDSAGNVQPDEASWNRLGYGNNAVRTVVVEVK